MANQMATYNHLDKLCADSSCKFDIHGQFEADIQIVNAGFHETMQSELQMAIWFNFR